MKLRCEQRNQRSSRGEQNARGYSNRDVVGSGEHVCDRNNNTERECGIVHLIVG